MQQGEEISKDFTLGKDKCPEGWQWKDDGSWSVNASDSVDRSGKKDY